MPAHAQGTLYTWSVNASFDDYMMIDPFDTYTVDADNNPNGINSSSQLVTNPNTSNGWNFDPGGALPSVDLTDPSNGYGGSGAAGAVGSASPNYIGSTPDGSTLTGTITVDSSGNLVGINLSLANTSFAGSDTFQCMSAGDYSASIGCSVANDSAGTDMWSVGGNDTFFMSDGGNYVLDVNLPDLTGHSLSDSLSNFADVFTLAASSGANDPYSNYGSYPTSYIAFDTTTPNLTVQNTFADAQDFTNSNGAVIPTNDAQDGLTNLTLSSVTSSDPGNPAPEPASLALLGSGLIGLGAFGRRLRRRRK